MLELESETESESDETSADGDDAEAGDTPVKKRTRRGSRGGRRRKKRPVGVDGVAATDDDEADELDGVEGDAGDDAEAVVAAAATDTPPGSGTTPKAGSGQRPPRRRAPRIHVPDGDRPSVNGADAGDHAAFNTRACLDGRGAGPSLSGVETDAEAAELTADGEPRRAGQEEDPARLTRWEEPAQASGRRGGEHGATQSEAGEAEGEPVVDDAAAPLTSEPENGAVPEADVKPMLRPPAPPRQRARKPAVVATPKDEQVPADRAEPVAEPVGEPGYVPMSEWIDDFDARRP